MSEESVLEQEQEQEKEKSESRKDFLKTAFTVGLAVTGISALTSCGSDGKEGAAGLPGAVGQDLTLEIQKKYAFAVDLAKCSDCEACAIACKTENDVRLGVQRNGVLEKEIGSSVSNVKRRNVPWLCNHCADPICISECPADEVDATFTSADIVKADGTTAAGVTTAYKKRATYKRPDGVVLVDQDRCIKCGRCVKLCPYGARYLDPAKGTADKCNLCVHRLDKGILPACVVTCPAEARTIGEAEAIKAKGGLTIRTDKNTQPMVFYSSIDQETLNDVYFNGSESLKGKNKATVGM
jgi:tetrathionate reductase subunit B